MSEFVSLTYLSPQHKVGQVVIPNPVGLKRRNYLRNIEKQQKLREQRIQNLQEQLEMELQYKKQLNN